jgi:hypothetical protein
MPRTLLVLLMLAAAAVLSVLGEWTALALYVVIVGGLSLVALWASHEAQKNRNTVERILDRRSRPRWAEKHPRSDGW